MSQYFEDIIGSLKNNYLVKRKSWDGSFPEGGYVQYVDTYDCEGNKTGKILRGVIMEDRHTVKNVLYINDGFDIDDVTADDWCVLCERIEDFSGWGENYPDKVIFDKKGKFVKAK
jgi:hypothetical protein